MQNTTSKKPQTDALSIMLLVAAALSLAVSIPATYKVASFTHTSALAAGLVVVIAELMAFASKILTRYFPTWEGPLNWFARLMLAAAVLPNAVEGADALATKEMTGAWDAVRSFELWTFPLGAFLLVGVWAALPSLGVYLSLAGWVKRQRELEIETSPEAVVERRLNPIMVELRFQEALDSRMEQMVEGRRKFAEKLLREVAQLPAPAPRPARVDYAESLGLPPDPFEDEPAFLSPLDVFLAATEPAFLSPLDVFLEAAELTRDSARNLLAKHNRNTAESAYEGLRLLGKLPAGVSLAGFKPLYQELVGVTQPRELSPFPEPMLIAPAVVSPGRHCQSCGDALNQGAYGVAVKAARKGDGTIRCTTCRNAAKKS